MHKRELPGWCQMLDELTSETANERDLDVSEARRVRIRKNGREKEVEWTLCRQAGVHTHQRCCEHHTQKGGTQQ